MENAGVAVNEKLGIVSGAIEAVPRSVSATFKGVPVAKSV